jgi:hypothetical protein
MKIFKGQIYVRSWPAKAMESAKTAIVGICLADDSNYEDKDLEQIKGYILNRENDAELQFIPSGYEKICSNIKTLDASSILTSQEWPRPSRETGMEGGGLFFRKINARIDDRQVFLVLGVFDCMVCEDHMMWDISGKTGTCVLFTNPRVPGVETRGESLGCVLKKPFWGWDKEKFCLTHSLHMDVAKMCERYDLLEMGLAQESYEGEFEELRTYVESEMYFNRKDELFQTFRKKMIKENGSVWSRAIETRSEKENFSKRSMEIIRDLKS